MTSHGVTILRMQALRGPNLYAYKPVLRVELDIGPFEERPSDTFPGFVERLTSWLPGLHKHECSIGRPGGFVERLRRGTWLAHICEHVTIALQNEMGFDVAFGRARGTGQRGVYNIVIGGHEDKEHDRLILRQVTDCARRGRVVVCTVASDVPQELWETYERIFRELGCAEVVHLDIERRADLMLDPPLRLIEGADAFFFTGGGQLKITTRFAGTRLCTAVEEFYRKGGTVAGTSAGAAVMAETMLVSGPSRETHKIGEALQMAPGLGFIRDVIIDQHFAERGRIGRLLGAVAQNPRFIGLGIDEDTAVVVEREERFTVIGAGAVYVADAEDMTYTNVAEEETSRALSLFNVRLHVLSQGDSYELRTRQPSHQFAKGVEERLDRSEHRRKGPSPAEAAGASVH